MCELRVQIGDSINFIDFVLSYPDWLITSLIGTHEKIATFNNLPLDFDFSFALISALKFGDVCEVGKHLKGLYL